MAVGGDVDGVEHVDFSAPPAYGERLTGTPSAVSFGGYGDACGLYPPRV